MGQSPSSYTYNETGDGLPFFQGKAEFGKLYPTARKWCSSPVKVAELDDILMSIRAPVGPTNLAPQKVCIGRGLAAIRGYNGIEQKYLLYYFRNIESWLSAQGTGTTFKAISGDFIKKIEFVLAPEKEQKRIADKLDQLLAAVDSCKTRLDTIPGIIKRFRQSVLAAATSGELTADWREGTETLNTTINNEQVLFDIPKCWSWKIIGSHADVKGGKRLPKGAKLVLENTGFPYVKAGQLKHGTVQEQDQEYLPPIIQKLISRYIVDSGDVYITIVGACIGDAGIIPVKYDKANLTENAAKLCNLNGVVNDYLAFWLQSPVAQNHIKFLVKSGAQGKLALMRIKEIPIPLPSISEQHEIVRRVEALFAVADRLEARYQAARVQVEQLTPSFLAKAFRGELVPQDPNDEPAEKLLNRIRSAQAKNGTVKSVKRQPKSPNHK